jgi:hypothetical protein
MYDAEGTFDEEPCPRCGATTTVTYHYLEGFSELECLACAFRSDWEEVSALQRYHGDLLERRSTVDLPVPVKKLKA